MHELVEPVAELMRHAAHTVVLPRFRTLTAGDIHEKTPGEIVTVADRETERLLADGLRTLPVSARIIGEEAAADDPGLLTDLGSGAIWLVDPIDGTANYAAGRSPFGIMIALVVDGATSMAWLLDPPSGRLCHAVHGGGAWIDGVRVTSRDSGGAVPIAALATQFMSADKAAALRAVASTCFELRPIPRCAAEHYPRLCLGENDIAMFERTLPWDHAAGALFLEEAGGRARRWSGQEYRIDDGQSGLLAAASPAMWGVANRALAASVGRATSGGQCRNDLQF